MAVHILDAGNLTLCGRPWVRDEGKGVRILLDAVTPTDYRGMEYKRVRPCLTCGYALRARDRRQYA